MKFFFICPIWILCFSQFSPFSCHSHIDLFTWNARISCIFLLQLYLFLWLICNRDLCFYHIQLSYNFTLLPERNSTVVFHKCLFPVHCKVFWSEPEIDFNWDKVLAEEAFCLPPASPQLPHYEFSRQAKALNFETKVLL